MYGISYPNTFITDISSVCLCGGGAAETFVSGCDSPSSLVGFGSVVLTSASIVMFCWNIWLSMSSSTSTSFNLSEFLSVPGFGLGFLLPPFGRTGRFGLDGRGGLMLDWSSSDSMSITGGGLGAGVAAGACTALFLLGGVYLPPPLVFGLLRLSLGLLFGLSFGLFGLKLGLLLRLSFGLLFGLSLGLLLRLSFGLLLGLSLGLLIGLSFGLGLSLGLLLRFSFGLLIRLPIGLLLKFSLGLLLRMSLGLFLGLSLLLLHVQALSGEEFEVP